MGGGTEVGYPPLGLGAVEIHCFREQQLCTEAVASVHHHSEGADLAAESYLYAVTGWTGERVQALAFASAAGGCMDRRLSIYPEHDAASLEWVPADGCGGNSGVAMLIGDHLD